MKQFIVFNDEGRILRVGSCDDPVFSYQARDGEFVLEGMANDILQYISRPDNVIVDRPTMPITINKLNVVEDEEITISSIPVGAKVDIDGEENVINDGELILTFDTIGTYKIKFRCFPYLDWEREIVCA